MPLRGKELRLPLRIFVSYGSRPIAAGAGKDKDRDKDAAASHAELVVFHSSAHRSQLRCLCVFGRADDIGCVFATPTDAATCIRGAPASHTHVFFDTVRSLMPRVGMADAASWEACNQIAEPFQ
jgi:hypothetical protein